MEVFLNILAVSGANIGELITELKSLPEVEFVNSVSGAFDLQARVRVRDHQHLTRLLINRIWQIPTIQRTETQLSFATVSQRDFTQNLLGYIRDHNEISRPPNAAQPNSHTDLPAHQWRVPTSSTRSRRLSDQPLRRLSALPLRPCRPNAVQVAD